MNIGTNAEIKAKRNASENSLENQVIIWKTIKIVAKVNWLFNPIVFAYKTDFLYQNICLTRLKKDIVQFGESVADPPNCISLCNQEFPA